MNEERLFAVLNRIATALETLARAKSCDFARTPEGLPICPKHNAVMKKREKQGDTWFSHRVIHPSSGEELYCRGYRSKNSPGFDIPPAQSPSTTPSPTSAPSPARQILDAAFPR